MKKLKVLTVVGTRPEIIRLACVLQKLDASPALEHILVHTGQNYDYELNEVFFEDLGLRRPDHFLNAAGGNATITAGQILINIGRETRCFSCTGRYEFLSLRDSSQETSYSYFSHGSRKPLFRSARPGRKQPEDRRSYQ